MSSVNRLLFFIFIKQSKIDFVAFAVNIGDPNFYAIAQSKFSTGFSTGHGVCLLIKNVKIIR